MQTEIPSSPSTHRIAFTVKEAAQASGLSRSLLYVAIARGTLCAKKCGTRTLILDTDLRRFLRKLPPLAKTETASTGANPRHLRGKA
jgi:excisionase family DNA binding protein